MRRISDVVAHMARWRPDVEAAVFEGRRWSYGELDAQVDALARALLAAGVGKGDRVATLQTPRPEFLVSLLATASIGAIWVGLNPRYRADEIARIVAHARPSLLISRSEIGGRRYDEDLELARRACGRRPRLIVFDGDPVPEGAAALEELLGAGAGTSDSELARAREQCGGREPCMIVYTSGSTGVPKGALLGHEGILEFCREQNRLWPVDPVRVLNYFPINHVGCVIDLALPCLLAGGCIVFMERFEAARSLELAAAERVTLLGSVPSVFHLQLAVPQFESYDLSALQLIVFEGAPMPAALIDRLLLLGVPLATNYGMTETTSAITALAPTRDAELLANTVGNAFDGVDLKLMRDDGEEAAPGEAGEVWARSRYNLIGYWNDAQATSRALTGDGFFRTGDLAVRRGDGRYTLVGRLREMFKSGGYNVYPREIETVLEAHPGVAAAAVVGVPDPLWQEVGVAFVEVRGPLEIAALEAWCRERLANYKRPKRFEIVPALPLLPIGKVDRQALRRAALGQASQP
jgi:acyl-CoA synthetase (AMP-forming)/AMP-acid ligase II